jgi:hypothetical protein
MTGSASLPVGQYKLNMPIKRLSCLTEFSSSEYAAFENTFKGENKYNAPEIEFVKQRWQVTLGTVHGKIYKTAFFFNSDREFIFNETSSDVLKFCQQHFGKAPEQQEDEAATVYIWDAADGNVIMQCGRLGSLYTIGLFQTSKNVNTFSPKGSSASTSVWFGCVFALIVIFSAIRWGVESLWGEREGTIRTNDCRTRISVVEGSSETWFKKFTCSYKKTVKGYLISGYCEAVDTNSAGVCETVYFYPRKVPNLCTDPKYPHLGQDGMCHTEPQ